MHELPKLEYEYDALEPHIDAKTMEIHHSKHHQAYVDKLNGAVKGTEFENMDVNEILKSIDKIPEDVRTAVKNNGGGHANHSFFWQIMSPNGGGEASGKVGDAIKEVFGSFEKFKEEFSNAAATTFGSGWAWLVAGDGKLSVVSTSNQDTPINEGKVPLLCIDVWEHAYYLKFQNKRQDYISAWWNVVNWNKVNELFGKER